MEKYKKEDILEISHRIGVTKEVDEILRKWKKEKKESKAKLICNLIIEKYNES